MKSLLHQLVRISLAAGMTLFAAVNVHAQDNSPGIVRISKPSTAAMNARQVTPVSFGHYGRNTGSGYYVDSSQSPGCPVGTNCPNQGQCPHGGHCPWGSGCRHCWHGHDFAWHYNTSDDMVNYFRCKFGYFIPTGAGGSGVPLAGMYSRVYPQDPHYFDQRDGQVWGAQGYGLPMAVPLAPTVGHAYNYGWGTPSSRLTPISRPAY